MAKEKDEVLTAEEEKHVDEKINETGTDVPTVEKPKAAPKKKAEPKPEPVKEEPAKPVTTEELLSAVRFLAGRVSSNAEMLELQQAFPRVFK